MKKGLTEMVFILDRSGSMCGLEKDTIGGFNSMIKQQKQAEGSAVVSTVLFDDEIKVLHDRVAIDKIREMTDEDYFTCGCTALLDAVGGAIHHIGNIHKYARNDDVPEKTIFVIITDGLENSSCRYKQAERKIRLGVSVCRSKYRRCSYCWSDGNTRRQCGRLCCGFRGH